MYRPAQPVSTKPKLLFWRQAAPLLYKNIPAPTSTTGDAYVAAFNIGAEFANLEVLEFTLIPAPKGSTVPMAGLSPFTSKGGRFLNAAGERFLEKYDPERLEGTTRAILVQATYKEMLAGHGPISIDPSFIPDEKWDDEIQYEYAPKLAAAGIDCRRDRFEWVPALHTFLGGVFVNERCESGVSGLLLEESHLPACMDRTGYPATPLPAAWFSALDPESSRRFSPAPPILQSLTHWKLHRS